MGSGHGIGPKDDLQPGSLQRALEHFHVEWKDFLHLGEAFFGVAGRAEKLFFVIQIIVDHQPNLRIEPGAVTRHVAQIIVGGKAAVFHFGTAGVG